MALLTITDLLETARDTRKSWGSEAAHETVEREEACAFRACLLAEHHVVVKGM